MNENLIDRYLLNLLTQEEKQAFEAQLDNDAALKAEMLKQKEVIENIEGIGRLELKSELQEIHKKLNPDTNKSTPITRRLLFRIASAAIFVGLLSTGLWIIQQTPSNSELYSKNFEPFELSLVERSGGAENYAQIQNLYSQGKYTQVIPLFEDALRGKDAKSSQILLGTGISYLETDDPSKAISYFQRILVNKDFNFEDEAQWYLGLTYLKLNDVVKAKSHLKILADDSAKDHHQAAKKLISRLN